MLAVGGASNRDISDSLHVSVRTVEVHLGRVFAKLEVRTRVELTVLAAALFFGEAVPAETFVFAVAVIAVIAGGRRALVARR